MNKIDNYQIFDPKVDASLDTLSRKEAREHFKLYVSSTEKRIKELSKLTALANIELDYTLDSIKKIDKWFPTSVKENKHIKEKPDSTTFSICNDLSLYIGEILKSQCPKLKWKLNTLRKTDVSYQRPILFGFTKSKIKNDYVDLDLLLCQYAFRILKGKIEFGWFQNIVNSVIKEC